MRARNRVWPLGASPDERSRQGTIPISGPALAGPKVYGDTRARSIVQSFMNGGWLDIAVVGDSNTMSATSGAYGYVHGLNAAAVTLGKSIYGTGITPPMTRYSENGAEKGIGLGDWRCSTSSRITSTPRQSGTVAGGATAYAGWSPGNNFVQYGPQASAGPPVTTAAVSDWAYMTGGTSLWDAYSGTWLTSTHPLAAAGTAVRYRVTHSVDPSGSATGLRLAAVQDTGGTLIQNTNYTTVGTAGTIARTDLPFTTAGTSGIRCSYGYGSVPPFNVFSNSVYRQSAGLGVTSHLYYAGGTTAQIASVISGASSLFFRTLLADMRTRQIAAGGRGNVMILSHSGINDSVADWQTQQQTLHDSYRAAWSALGYPDSELAFVSMVGVMRNSGDTSINGVSLGPIRQAARSWAMSTPGVTFIDMSEVTSNAELVANSWYQGAVTQHLSTAGYDEMASRILTNLAG